MARLILDFSLVAICFSLLFIIPRRRLDVGGGGLHVVRNVRALGNEKLFYRQESLFEETHA
jgi:hypothetical protein